MRISRSTAHPAPKCASRAAQRISRSTALPSQRTRKHCSDTSPQRTRIEPEGGQFRAALLHFRLPKSLRSGWQAGTSEPHLLTHRCFPMVWVLPFRVSACRYAHRLHWLLRRVRPLPAPSVVIISAQRRSCKSSATLKNHNLLIICVIEIKSVADGINLASSGTP